MYFILLENQNRNFMILRGPKLLLSLQILLKNSCTNIISLKLMYENWIRPSTPVSTCLQQTITRLPDSTHPKACFCAWIFRLGHANLLSPLIITFLLKFICLKSCYISGRSNKIIITSSVPIFKHPFDFIFIPKCKLFFKLLDAFFPLNIRLINNDILSWNMNNQI